MVDLPWLRLYTDTVDNEKIRLLAFEDRWHYIAILCLKQQGIIRPDNELMERQIAVKLGLQQLALHETKKRLMEVNLIDENFNPIGWEKHQYKSDNSTERVRKHRKNIKLAKEKRNVTRTLPNSSETLPKRQCNALDTEKEKEIYRGKKCPRFAPPELDDIKKYIAERGSNVDAEKFFDFYEAKGWMVGKNRMKNWQAAIRTWEKTTTNTPTDNLRNSYALGGI